jgi:hypothetical protein
MAEFVVQLEEQPELELDTLDIGVEENLIAFDITGTIRDIDDDLLAELANETVRPTEIHFTTDD